MGPSMAIETFDRLTLFGRRWFFRIIDAGNGQTLAQSEAYNSARARDSTAVRFANKLEARILEV